MFLTKKGFRKALIMSVCYFALGSICFLLAAHFENMDVGAELLWGLGMFTYLLCVPVFFCVRYTEGKGKVILLGSKLVQKELRPAAFIKEYESLKNDKSLVINKPSIDVLMIVASAYDSLDDRVNTLKTLDELVAVAGEKKLAYATALKASVLYAYGTIEEAEKLFAQAQKMKLDATCTALLDVVLKSDRAFAMGDYEVAEAYYLRLLEQKFPKLDNFVRLAAHYKLGEIYEQLEKTEKAISYYQYCVNNGGETAIKLSAIEKLQHLE